MLRTCNFENERWVSSQKKGLIRFEDEAKHIKNINSASSNADLADKAREPLSRIGSDAGTPSLSFNSKSTDGSPEKEEKAIAEKAEPDLVSNLPSLQELQEKFAYFFLNRNTSRFARLFSHKERIMLTRALSSTFEMKCLLELEQRAFHVQETRTIGDAG